MDRSSIYNMSLVLQMNWNTMMTAMFQVHDAIVAWKSSNVELVMSVGRFYVVMSSRL